MGKEVIVAADGPGFLVNRCGRPFNGEGLRLLQERVATHEQIDRICRLGGGFRMGPFELMDLVGIDVGFEVAKSFDELSFGEPRWRPNPIQARMVAAGRLGRKTGRGYYEYAEDGALPAGRPGAAGARRRRRHAPDAPRRRARWPTGSASAPGTRGTSSARAGRPSSCSTRGVRPAGVAARRRAGRRAVRLRAASRHAASPARSASTCCPTRQLVELTRLPDDARTFAATAVEECFGTARLRDRVGRGRARARARPDRQPARERGGLRDRRGRGLGRRRGHRPHARALAPARARSRGARRSASTTCWPCSTGCGTSAARSATGRAAAPARRGARA